MKVSHINFSDLSGGASIAANRICKALKTLSLETELRVQKKYSSLASPVSLAFILLKN